MNKGRSKKLLGLEPTIRAMLEAGVNRSGIARELGLDRRTVGAIASEMGYKPHPGYCKRKPTPVKYTGPIRCGDTYAGVRGFVWCRTGDSVTMYIVEGDHPPMDATPKLKTWPVSKLRKGGIQVPNFGGTVIFPRM